MKIRILLFLIISAILFLIYFRASLNINLVIETSDDPKIDMKIKFDDKIIFNDSVLTGPYQRSKIKLSGIRNGYHNVEIITKMGKSEYSERFLIILRRNIVIEYYKGDSNFKVPYFRTRTMFKEFFPD